MPRRMPPAWLNGGGAVTSSVTGLVTPCIVRLPVTEYELALDLLKLLETKVMTGYLAASKNLPEAEARKWQAAFAAMQADGTLAAIRRRHEQAKVDPVEDERRRIRDEPFN